MNLQIVGGKAFENAERASRAYYAVQTPPVDEHEIWRAGQTSTASFQHRE